MMFNPTFLRNAFGAIAVAGFAAFVVAGRAEAIVFDGTPDLALTSAVVAAGGGPTHFSSAKLFAVLTGKKRSAETKKLTEQFGTSDVRDTFAIFDFAVDDAVGIVTSKHIALPPPSPSPRDAKALAYAMYGAGVTKSGVWDVGYMVEHLITHPIHHAIMHDIDAKFGSKKNGEFHVVLAQMMDDLAIAYRTASR